MSCFEYKYCYFIFFSIGSAINFIILASLIIYYYTSRKKYVWFNSKILTIEKILDDNYEPYKIYNKFVSYGFYNALNFSYYELLKNSSRDKCPENLKQCGILDTFGNKLCLNKDYECPVNEIIIDFCDNKTYYKQKGYNSTTYRIISRNYDDFCIYYKNDKIDNNIIKSLIVYESIPKLIDNHNFIFDMDAYELKYEYKINNPNINQTENIIYNITNEKQINDSDKNKTELIKTIESEEKKIESWYEDLVIKSKISNDSEIVEYINSKMNKNDIDENYVKIYDNLYIKNFIGFENTEEMDKLNNIVILKFIKIYFLIMQKYLC